MSVFSKICLRQGNSRLRCLDRGVIKLQASQVSIFMTCTCTCLRYTKLRIPCEHGLAAAIEFGIDPKVVVGWWYGLQTFSDSFQEPILPIADPKDVVIPQHISDLILIPPNSRRPPGRPTTKRIPSRGENRKKRQKRLIPNQCTRCRQAGHNKKTCKNPI
ncbi:uncharacterized protein LOC110227333 [Arabidopsis lyrata subsp. lyrata]|uniref:uncharacterized protein LOC110227333 n=1 Tax=Arabidopsis lyrata subsp. lyrata TaxID=81972 RepID=UPI000A29DF1B|nr:uncharacterized protein LOC110227333 [Arabidopsis lyrata subsp. lyrata]|eukprot:XP_020876982.1 uncharacterized protein LOC110227333 [Arabidopsis lyrata subsp. lyrata]